jgi:cytidylate kinase
MAKERGMTLEEFNALGETKGFTDRDVDRWQGQEAKRRGKGVFEGRLSFYFIPTSFKVFLRSNYTTAARRIFSDPSSIRRFEGAFRTERELVRSLKERVASDTRRYQKYYGVDIFDPAQYDLVITTTSMTPERVAERILSAMKRVASGGDKLGMKSRLSTRKKKK